MTKNLTTKRLKPSELIGAYRSRKEALMVRRAACECAAIVLAGRSDLDAVPTMYTLCVFFESYMAEGAYSTQRDFGPGKPVKLRSIKGGVK